MLRVATIGIVAVMCALPAYAGSRENAHVRPVGTEIAALIEEGVQRSPTLRTLVADLQRTDVTVFVEFDVLQNDLAGALRFITRAGSLRLLRISLRRTLTKAQQLKTLGHELQHALEVAKAPQVVDERSLRAYYQTHGHETGIYDRFDTADAQKTGETVGDDLRGRRALASSPPPTRAALAPVTSSLPAERPSGGKR